MTASCPVLSHLSYAVIPLIFVPVALWLINNMLFAKLVESLVGLVLIALGLPLYWYFQRR
jgi:sulfite exporter TauE/SafE